MILPISLKKQIILLILLFAIFITGSFLFLAQFYLNKQFEEDTRHYIQHVHANYLNEIDEIITNSSASLQTIRSSQTFSQSLESQNYSQLYQLFKLTAQSNKYIMQIRFIDSNGDEKIRLDREKNTIREVEAQSLQNKTHRDYFKDALQHTQMFVSQLNLNIENNKIDFPYKPTFRVILPVYEKNFPDLFKGILIINIKVDLLLHSEVFETMIVKKDKTIISPFQLQTDQDLLTVDGHIDPKVWEKIISNERYNDTHLFSQQINNRFQNDIILITHLKHDYLQGIEKDRKSLYLTIMAVSLLFTIAINTLLFGRINNLFQAFYKERYEAKIHNAKEVLDTTKSFLSKPSIDPDFILTQSTTPMLLLTQENEIFFTNLAFEKLFDYKNEAILGRDVNLLYFDDLEQKNLQKIDEAISNKEPITTLLRVYTHSKKLLYVELSVSPIFDEDDDLKYFLFLYKDITKEQKILHELRDIF